MYVDCAAWAARKISKYKRKPSNNDSLGENLKFQAARAMLKGAAKVEFELKCLTVIS